MTKNLSRLISIMKTLRDKEKGCPWDIKQTPKTLAPYAIEEAYELSEAIENGDVDEYKKELGDLLLQVVFHSQVAKEEGWFDFDDVAKSISDKMEFRHSHIFGDDDALTAEEVEKIWKKKKAEEKAKKEIKDSVLDDVSSGLPSMLEAMKISKIAVDTGFEWDTVVDVINDVREELFEVEEEVTKDEVVEERVLDEIGDVFFAAVNLARKAGIDPEQALKHTNNKFKRRFKFVEDKHVELGLDLNKTTLEQKEEFWQGAKKEGL